MSTPPKTNTDINPKSNRLRASFNIAPAQPNVLHRTLTGRIGQSNSVSSLSASGNRRSVDSKPARDRTWQPNRAEQIPVANLSSPEYIGPQLLAVISPFTAASTGYNFHTLDPISHLEEPSVLVGETTNLGQLGGSREGSRYASVRWETQQ